MKKTNTIEPLTATEVARFQKEEPKKYMASIVDRILNQRDDRVPNKGKTTQNKIKPMPMTATAKRKLDAALAAFAAHD